MVRPEIGKKYTSSDGVIEIISERGFHPNYPFVGITQSGVRQYYTAKGKWSHFTRPARLADKDLIKEIQF